MLTLTLAHKTQDEDKQNTKTQHRKLKKGEQHQPHQNRGEPCMVLAKAKSLIRHPLKLELTLN
jgi:hypothetical protein